ncbi:MAG: hypothetical protein ABIP39_08160 [Polyangiaceae bacterium]
MLNFIRDGGWGMFLIMAFGTASLVAAAWYAYRASAKPPGSLWGMGLATLFVTFAGFASDLKAVFDFLAGDKIEPEQRARILCQGLSESINTIIMGFMFLSLTALVAAYGSARADRRAQAT